jgi:Fungal specific transcription factor domain
VCGDTDKLSAAFYLGSGLTESPFTSYILPMAQKIPSVRCAVAALALSHMANRLEDESLKDESLGFRIKATQLLRQRLGDSQKGPDMGSLACMVLLAQNSVGGPSPETRHYNNGLL